MLVLICMQSMKMRPFYIPCRQLELDARDFVCRTDGYHLSAFDWNSGRNSSLTNTTDVRRNRKKKSAKDEKDLPMEREWDRKRNIVNKYMIRHWKNREIWMCVYLRACSMCRWHTCNPFFFFFRLLLRCLILWNTFIHFVFWFQQFDKCFGEFFVYYRRYFHAMRENNTVLFVEHIDFFLLSAFIRLQKAFKWNRGILKITFIVFNCI